MNVTFKRVSGLTGLEEIKQEWETLTDQQRSVCFFHKWIWYKSFLVNLAQHPENINFVLMLGDDVPLCILPFEKYHETKGGIEFRTLRFPAHSHVNLCDIITGRTGMDCMVPLIHYLSNVIDLEWDVFFAAKLLEDSSIVQSITQGDEHAASLQQTATSAYIHCDTESSHVDKLSSKFRRNIRRLMKRAEKKGALSFHYVKNKKDLPVAFEDFLRVEASGWKGQKGLGSAIMLSPSLRGFYVEIMEGFSQIDECQINLIKIDNKCVGAQFCLIQNGIIHILKIGYDERYKDIAPGSLLLFDLICQSTNNPLLNSVSLVTGPPWAKRWHVHEKKVYKLIITNRTIKGKLYNTLLKVRNKNSI